LVDNGSYGNWLADSDEVSRLFQSKPATHSD
jgi:hypothetical protein